jgi:hypothetical protein
MAGEFTAGFSGGQRKMLLFELIYQRTKHLSDLLICLDEPFAGVTDDFLPYLKQRVEDIRKRHNLLLVTNDHIAALTAQSDNILTVSAIDRKIVKINETEGIDRELALHALSNGNNYTPPNSKDDLKFFFQTEVFSLAGGIGAVMAFTTFAMAMIILSYWDSQAGSEALVLVAVQIVAFFCINPYLIALSDWRNFMTEESEALMHASVAVNKALKTTLTLVILTVITCIAYIVLQIVIETMDDSKYLFAMFFDSASLTFPFLCTGLYTNLSFQACQIVSSLPFLFMIFFSTTFSPGAGVDGIKGLRYLFARFYFWCMVPGYKEVMEGCPADDMLEFWCAASGCIGLVMFLVGYAIYTFKESRKAKASDGKREKIESSPEFQSLQKVLFADKLVVGNELSTKEEPEAVALGDDNL